MLDAFYRKIIDSSEEGYALIKLEHNKDNSISNFSFVFSNSVFKKLIDNNCDLITVFKNHLKTSSFNFSNNETIKFEWICNQSSLNYSITLSFLNKDHIIINTKHSVFKENILLDEYTDFLCNAGNEVKCKLEKSEKKYKLLFESMYESFALH